MAEFNFSCPNCGQPIQSEARSAGSQIKCPACQQLIVAPQPSSAPQPASPPACGKTRNAKAPVIVAAAVLFVIMAGVFLFWKLTSKPALVALWSGEVNGRDSAGGNDALLTDIPFGPGKVGQAFVFNGESSEVKIPASRDFRVGLTNGFTLEAWINPSDVSQRRPIFEWNAGDGTTYWGVHFYIDPITPTGPQPGALYANILSRNGGWHQIWSPGGTVREKVFQYVALTYDRPSGAAKIYCNGEVVAEERVGHFAPLTSYDLYLGKRPLTQGETYTFEGLLDEAAVYNRALSEKEIQAHYRRHQ